MGLKFKDKIMLYCFRVVKFKQGLTTGTLYYLYDALSLIVSMWVSGLIINESNFKYGDLGSFPGREG